MSDREEDHERIWLQQEVGADGRTWCQDNVNDDDTEYVRADLAEQRADHEWYGERYRFCRRHILKILHAMGDPETPVRDLDALIASGDPEGVIDSYIEALLGRFEGSPGGASDG